MDMQVCMASMTTATPSGWRESWMQSRICSVRRSWTCRRRAAQGEEFDVLDKDHLAVRLGEHGGTDDGLAVLLIALREELPGLRHALGRFDKPFALRVLAQQLENGLYVPGELFRGLFVVFFDFPVCHGIDFVAPCDGNFGLQN